MTYRSFPETLMVFASVPFACVGGVLALSWREMPVSISAAVGFITLSGVSVLSSMILASAWRATKQPPEIHVALETQLSTTDPHHQENKNPTLTEISVGCLRTILMTALVASVGFIPMATSDGSGAEVQRPLATVVIGGVISSMVFTLFVLPILFQMLEDMRSSNRAEPN